MKIKATLKALMLVALALLVLCAARPAAYAQDEKEKERPRVVGQQQPEQQNSSQPEQKPSETQAGEEVLVTDDKSADAPQDASTNAQDATTDEQGTRREQLSEEEAAILPYYNNYLSTYFLGPEDVISVTVFGQDRYSKAGIVIPPNGRISYPLVGNVFVAGKTTEQVEAELTKRLDEYIIDPKVTVSLEKAVSARYSVLGDVAQPGIRTMTRRLSVYEALAEAGGVLATGDKKKVVILRRQPDGNVAPIRVNVKDIESGKAKEIAYLVPGDQVVVPGNRLKTIQTLMGFLPVLNFARIFGLPF